ARLLLHRTPVLTYTLCLEFFGDLNRAVPAIVETTQRLEQEPELLLIGLEHLDARYIKAIGYTSKAARGDLPRMVLLADIAVEDETERSRLDRAAADILTLAAQRQGEGFLAVSAEARRQFWSDRSRTAAIAAHTNAFKINEDVVIPLPQLAAYSDGIERINIIQSTRNKLEILVACRDYLENEALEMAIAIVGSRSDEEWAILKNKLSAASRLLKQRELGWSQLLQQLDSDASHHPGWSHLAQAGESIFQLIQRGAVRISFRDEVAKPLREIFGGRDLAPIVTSLTDIHSRLRRRRIFVATHMHAGDGNVHTNIPVYSNDYQMLQQADEVVAEIMALASELGGVISGEHGIGLTKMQFLAQEAVRDFSRYKRVCDPEGHFNRGKLLPGSGLANAYTPSLQLLQQEAIILEASELSQINHAVKDCLRCGKCKPHCTTHVPRANLLYSPRNKILATGMVLEAFLYEEQTRRGISVRHFAEMNSIADHCTVCHRCLSPCPVNIDFGEVTVLMRSLLRRKGKRGLAVGTRAAIAFLNLGDPLTLKLVRKGVIEWGYAAQRLGYHLAKSLRLVQRKQLPRATVAKGGIREQVIEMVRAPLPAGLPARTMRAQLNIEGGKEIPIISNPEMAGGESEAVFYFPGCGSERLFSDIGMATLAILYRLGTQTVVPPGYICCGYPQSGVGDEVKAREITTENRVLLHRVANTLNYLDIKTVLLSCGTCLDQLLLYRLEQIFPGCKVMDIHEYLLQRGVCLQQPTTPSALYHDPCHSPLKRGDPLQTIAGITGQTVTLSDRCCGEAGTFAVSRPDIATQVRFRKGEELAMGVAQQPSPQTLYTTCPACQQGLSRYREETGLIPQYPVVAIAAEMWGEQWQHRFVEESANGGIERVLL
ncbi:MAG: DUF3400 domain-containing protein, partial [Gammaproteobacteria bacterium]|nr:DUF3400 domain-containing protein [Gammaproteobacteria bacterium]